MESQTVLFHSYDGFHPFYRCTIACISVPGTIRVPEYLSTSTSTSTGILTLELTSTNNVRVPEIQYSSTASTSTGNNYVFITSLLWLMWRPNGCDGVSNHQPHDCLLNRSFRRRSKKTSELRVTGLCAGNSPVTGEFPAQMASNAENVSIWWRHHDFVFAGNIIVHLANTSGAFILHQAMQRRGILQGPLLLTWINFNPIMPTKMWD